MASHCHLYSARAEWLTRAASRFALTADSPRGVMQGRLRDSFCHALRRPQFEYIFRLLLKMSVGAAAIGSLEPNFFIAWRKPGTQTSSHSFPDFESCDDSRARFYLDGNSRSNTSPVGRVRFPEASVH